MDLALRLHPRLEQIRHADPCLGPPAMASFCASTAQRHSPCHPIASNQDGHLNSSGERRVRISSVSVDRRAPPRLPRSAHGGHPAPTPPGRGHCRSCVRNTFCLVSTRGLVNDLIARKPVPPAPSKHRLVGVHEHQSKAGQQAAAMNNGCLTTSLESSPRAGSRGSAAQTASRPSCSLPGQLSPGHRKRKLFG